MRQQIAQLHSRCTMLQKSQCISSKPRTSIRTTFTDVFQMQNLVGAVSHNNLRWMEPRYASLTSLSKEISACIKSPEPHNDAQWRGTMRKLGNSTLRNGAAERIVVEFSRLLLKSALPHLLRSDVFRQQGLVSGSVTMTKPNYSETKPPRTM
jgi:hypothetical protein